MSFPVKPPKGKMVYPRRFMEGFDYRKDNLIVCTMSERQRILPKARKGASSRYKGVSYIQVKKRWRAALKVDLVLIPLAVHELAVHGLALSVPGRYCTGLVFWSRLMGE